MTIAKSTAGARLTYVWLTLSAITIAAWWIGPGHTHGVLAAGVPITIIVMVMGLVKARLIIRYFMEVRSAPRWLRLFTDLWLAVLWGAVLVMYLW